MVLLHRSSKNPNVGPLVGWFGLLPFGWLVWFGLLPFGLKFEELAYCEKSRVFWKPLDVLFPNLLVLARAGHYFCPTNVIENLYISKQKIVQRLLQALVANKVRNPT